MYSLTRRSLTSNRNLSNIVGRDNEIQKILRILLKENQNSVVIVGEKGIGKSTIIEGLAYRINNKLINLDCRIVELDVDEIIDHLSSESEINTEIFSNKDIYFIKNSPLLFSQTLVENRKTSKFLKFLSDNIHARIILTMNHGEYRKFIESDLILSKIFDVIKVNELSTSDLEEVLIKHLPGFLFEDGLIDDLINISNRYLKGSQPLKALSVLDEVKSFNKLSDKKYIETSDIKKIVSEKSGIPMESLQNNELEQLSNLEAHINGQVIGQEFAAGKIASVLKRARTGIKDPNRPLASFLFIGSSGVGKTEMAKVIAEIIFNSRTNLVRLDMSEFSETHNVQRLVGAPPGYVGYEEGGQLTNPVLDNPYSLLLFDEIEKANQKVHDIFLQVLDEGRLTDGQGRTVDFRNTIIVSTSNASYAQILSDINDYGMLNNEDFIRTKVIPALVKYFRPEFLNRFDEIIVFNPLNNEQLNKIAALQIKKLEKRLLEQGVQFKVKEETMEKIYSAVKSKLFGAREVNRLIQKHIENPIANEIVNNPQNKYIYI